MKSYIKLVKKLAKRHSKLFGLKHDAVSHVMLSKISYVITPFFIYAKISPNIVTFINFLVSLTSIVLVFTLEEKFFLLSIVLYFIYRLIDFVDGHIARHFKISSFYGRFIDGLLDIFVPSFLLFSISYYCFKVYDNEILLIIGSVAALCCVFDSFIYDRYSALARWSNEENKKKVTPYLRKIIYPRITFTYTDIYSVCLFALPFLFKNDHLFKVVAYILFITFIISALQNVILHLIYAYKNFDLNAKDKKFYTKKNN